MAVINLAKKMFSCLPEEVQRHQITYREQTDFIKRTIFKRKLQPCILFFAGLVLMIIFGILRMNIAAVTALTLCTFLAGSFAKANKSEIQWYTICLEHDYWNPEHKTLAFGRWFRLLCDKALEALEEERKGNNEIH